MNEPSAQLKKLIFWDPCLSPHKSDFFEALAKLKPDIEIICCADTDVPDDRRKMGWSSPHGAGYQVIVGPDHSTIKKLARDNAPTTFHVLSGIRWIPTLMKAIAEIKASKARYAIMSEPRVAEGWSGKIRRLQSWLTEGSHRKNAEAIFAIGRNGPPWFKSVGYSSRKIIPFAYFVAPPNKTDDIPSVTDRIRAGYLGRLVEMKGIFDLVEAVSLIGNDITLAIAGSGPEAGRLNKKCIEYNINTEFHGVIPILEIGSFLEKIDVLVLASTEKDGWGAVVSEALMSGVAVIATPMVGASLVLERDIFGQCVAPASPEAISAAILNLKNSGEFLPERRKTREILARDILSPRAGAAYFISILSWLEGKSEKPIPFFRTENR